MKILIVEDDLPLADVLSFTLRRSGYEVIAAHDGLSALELWESEAPALILLDLNLPRLGGLAVCQRIRAVDQTPIIILSVRGEEDDVVRGLELGADDYIAKPFSPRQLVARMQAVLRRAGIAAKPGQITVFGVTLDPSRREIHLPGQPAVSLTALECRLLEVLMINSGHVLPADSLITAVWGPSGGDRAMLKQLVYRLRRKLETDPQQTPYLETVPGVGYAFVIPGSEE